MDIFTELDALDAIRFSGQKEDSWYIEEAREAMAKGLVIVPLFYGICMKGKHIFYFMRLAHCHRTF